MKSTIKQEIMGFVLAALILGAVASAWAFDPPKTPAGARTTAYFAAFNAGEDSMRAYFLSNAAAQALKDRPVEDRLTRYRGMRSELGLLRPVRVVRSDSAAITIVAKSDSGGWLTFAFQFEPVSPWKLVSIGIEQSDSDAAETPLTPMTEKQFLDSLGLRLDKMAKADEFSGVVLVARNWQPIFQKPYGLASKEFNVPNRIDTKFNLGSMNKFFTRLAIWQLIEKGNLRLEDTLGKFLPDYPNADARRKVTIENLVEMMSGIGDFFGDQFDMTPKDRFRSNRSFLPLFDSLPLEFEPGRQRQYSNGGYIVLGAIIEAVSGSSYHDYVREHIFVPAGMTATDSYEADDPVDNLAEGYTREPAKNPDPWKKNIYSRPAKGSAAGGGYSTVGDLLKFTVALQENRLLTPANTEWFLMGAKPGGANANAAGRPRRIGIAGGAPGINASMEADFTGGSVLIVLGNYDPPNTERVARLARRWLAAVNDKK
ncbi:MAG: beta-lactamase family protein [candidate division Zixibacteria bacterium]|nr:beta-lactamase family protein [candidate division Zixibacteria bacterium]